MLTKSKLIAELSLTAAALAIAPYHVIFPASLPAAIYTTPTSRRLQLPLCLSISG